MKNNLIFIIMGKSGAGKTSLSYEVSKLLNIPIVVSSTSRPIREREQVGVDYYYKTKEEMLEISKNDGFIEYVEYNGCLYGVEKAEIEKMESNCLVVVEPNGFEQFKEYFGHRVIPIYIDTPDKLRLLRSLHREHNPNCYEICRRLIADIEKFSKIEADMSIKKIDNSKDINLSVEDLCNYIYKTIYNK